MPSCQPSEPSSAITAGYPMHNRVGDELIYECPQPTPVVLMLNTHHSCVADIVVPDHLTTDSSVPIHGYHDTFGNRCSRIAGR